MKCFVRLIKKINIFLLRYFSEKMQSVAKFLVMRYRDGSFLQARKGKREKDVMRSWKNIFGMVKEKCDAAAR